MVEMHGLSTIHYHSTKRRFLFKLRQVHFNYRTAPTNVCNCTRKMIQLFLSSLLLLLTPALAQFDIPTDFLSSSCGGSGHIMNGSSMESNLKEVLSSLVEKVSKTGYNISWYGEDGDKIYGLAQCRGDLSAPTCRDCASYAKMSLSERCRGHNAGSIQLSGCFLRYGTHNFYSKLDTSFSAVDCGNSTNSTDADARGLNRPVASLLSRLVAQMTAFNDTNFITRSNDGVFALAQCWRDLSWDQCNQCLVTVYNGLRHCPRGTMQGDGLQINCMILFARHEFYKSDHGPTSISPALIILGLTIGGYALLMMVVAVILIWKREVLEHRYQKPLLHGDYKASSKFSTAISKSKLNYKSQILYTATNNFNLTNKIGQGGFGVVYKGILPDGREIAVKKLFSNRDQSWVSEFFNEVNLISHVQHKSLVKLLGCSVDGPDRLLVYEYLPNKSLDQFLFDENMGNRLDWLRRFEIILGIASGLAYLHHESDIRIIHRDIKASNILLDQHFKPKIADFGLVRYFAEDQTHLSTTIVGTRAYMAPEYLVHGHLTEKVDVYAFGVLVLEIISGMKNKPPGYANDLPSLLTMVWNHYMSGTLSSIIDPKIQENFKEEALQVVHVALLCTQVSATLRPSMSKVIMFLTSEDPNLPTPTQPPFIDINDSQSNTNTSVASPLETYNPSSNTVCSPPIPLSLNTISTNSYDAR